MRKLFFVKRNINEPTGASNWIEMNVDEFNKFISTEDGKARKNNFAPLFGFGVDDADYYIETTREEVSGIPISEASLRIPHSPPRRPSSAGAYTRIRSSF